MTNNAQGSALIYQFNTGSIKELNKDEFVSLMISAGLTNKSKSDLVKLPYRDIVETHKDKFKKLENGIYGFSGDIGKTVIVCLLDKTFDDFRNYCRKQGWKLEDEDQEELIKSQLKYKDYVYIGQDLVKEVEKINNLKERFFVKQLDNYLNNSADNRILALYGLKRTGKSYGMYQSIKKLLDKNIKVAYFNLDSNINMNELYGDLRILNNNGYDYIFLDEVTYVKNFFECCQRLADFHTDTNKKHIVIAGTDSYLIQLVYDNIMLGRMNTISTTWVSYQEYIYIMNKKIPYKYYLQTGGIFSISENYVEEHKDKLKELNTEEKNYLKEAVIDNIVHSIKRATTDSVLSSLRQYSEDKLYTALNHLIERENEVFKLKWLNETFNTGNKINMLIPLGLTEDKIEELKQRFKKTIHVNNEFEFDQQDLETLHNCLLRCEAITEYTYWNSNREERHYIFTQPALRYQQIKSLLDTINSDPYIISLKDPIKNNLIEQLENSVMSKIMENNIICHLVHLADQNTNLRVRQIRRNDKQEIDMLLYDINNSFIDAYEVKIREHKKKEEDCKWICEVGQNNLEEFIKNNFYKEIRYRYVIYNGLDSLDEYNNKEVKYLNVEKYLALLNKDNVFTKH